MPVMNLVTGAGGFLGRYIVEQLLARGESVRGFARGHYPELVSSGVEMVQGDIRDAQQVADACGGVHTVYHVAAVAGIWGPWERYHGINTVGTDNVIAAAGKGPLRERSATAQHTVNAGNDQEGNLR